MSFMLKISSGGVCAAAAVVLCFAFWPHVKPDKISVKSQVAQPEFVVASASTKPIATPTVAAAAAPTSESTLDKTALGKLAAVVATKPALSTAPPGPAFDKVALDKLAMAVQTVPEVETAPKTRGIVFPGDNAQPSPVAAPPVSPEAAKNCAQGLVALASGDIAAARRWLVRAADLGDARALLALGDAYNPAMLARLGVLGAPGDLSRAKEYYSRALSSGLVAARGRLASLATSAD
jgi:hypothetical protein